MEETRWSEDEVGALVVVQSAEDLQGAMERQLSAVESRRQALLAAITDELGEIDIDLAI